MGSLMSLAIIAVWFSLSSGGVTIQNCPSTSKYNVSFYLQSISNTACPNKWITDVQIYNHQQGWVQPTSYKLNTPFGDKYRWNCAQQPPIPNCEYSLPISVHLPTITNEPMTLTDVITNFNANATFETTCDLCIKRSQICSTNTKNTRPPSVSPTIFTSNYSITIENHNDTEEWWVAFYLDNIDLSCGGDIGNVEISDNYAYKNKWVDYTVSQFTSWGHYSFLWQNEENNASYTLPLSVRITRKYNNTKETIYACNVITNWHRLFTFNFGSNFCQNDPQINIDSCDSTDTTKTPTLVPSESPSVNPSYFGTATITMTESEYDIFNTTFQSGSDDKESQSNINFVSNYVIYIIIGGILLSIWLIVCAIIIFYKFCLKKKLTNDVDPENKDDTEISIQQDINIEKREPRVQQDVVKVETADAVRRNLNVDRLCVNKELNPNVSSSDEMYEEPRGFEMAPEVYGKRMGEKCVKIKHVDLNDMNSIDSEVLYQSIRGENIITNGMYTTTTASDLRNDL